jgi:thiamine-phosphate pyrophosphorylase
VSARPQLATLLRVLVVADPSAAAGRPLVEVVRAALVGGARAVQLRCKTESAREMAQLGSALRRETREHAALLFINDRVDVALSVGADGAHVGDDDLPLAAARAIVPPGFLLGRSVDVPADVPLALRDGADYLGVGPFRATASKRDLGDPTGVVGVSDVVRVAAGVPVVAIGGVEAADVPDLVRAGASGVAVIRAVMTAPDPTRAVEDLLRGFGEEALAAGG